MDRVEDDHFEDRSVRHLRAPRDYVIVLDVSTTHSSTPLSDERAAFIVGAHRPVHLPPRYLSGVQQFLRAPVGSGRFQFRAAPNRRRCQRDGTFYARPNLSSPLHLLAPFPSTFIGSDGCLLHAFSVHDFEPLVERFHAPPPVRRTFEVPTSSCVRSCRRNWDFDPEAILIPYSGSCQHRLRRKFSSMSAATS